MSEMLKITGLKSTVNEKEILKGVNLEIRAGEVHVIMGPNGAGKSTLANVIMGNSKYEVTEGSIFFEGEEITDEAVNERAKKGIFMSFQAPQEIPGITVENFLRTAKSQITGEQVKAIQFKKEMTQVMKDLDIDRSYAQRYLNMGYSGGEKKKNEILQMRILNPKLAILDETDSGLDVDAVKIVSKGVTEFKNEKNAILLITHHNSILDYLVPDVVHVMVDGRIVDTGDISLAREIEKNGYIKYREAKGDAEWKKEIKLI
ncbi:Fe-S cluster assembly ATPase SufC [Proteiniclasticum sp. BAD-10]|uniref:Fe-S cluster assembly ATPase SufC n=1 Tax=Proteiniclasticum sediminis TaxID=2804028 RepID=A0A941HPZ5_9CLOT|nr:Fe-S cluster assembly ATPase SufC [Proteiniclasticum sediminis]MBR0575515.1 Fe-S cluster assembly ATPase SufC [Proteiniclasticum sediminis]